MSHLIFRRDGSCEHGLRITGGDGVINAAVEFFYRGAIADAYFKRFSENFDMSVEVAKQELFMAMAFDSPNGYTAFWLRNVRTCAIERLPYGHSDFHCD